MSTNKWESLDDLTKPQLEELKLKTEIKKIRGEIDDKGKSWPSRNLGILIPSTIAFLTLLTGYITGFFNVEAKRLDLEKKLLTLDVYAFASKKEALTEQNEKLDLLNMDLEIQTAIHQKEALKAGVDKNKLAKDLSVINNERNQLEGEKKQLTADVVQLKKDIRLVPLYEYLANVCEEPDVISDSYKKLLTLLERKDELFDDYVQKIKYSIDTTSEISVKGILFRVLFESTMDEAWKSKLFSIAKEYAAEKRDYNNFNYYGNPELWRLFTWELGRNPSENIEIINFLTELIKTLGTNIEDISSIFSAIGLIKVVPGGFKLDEASPSNFCYLVERANALTIKAAENRYFENSGSYFLETNAPIAYVCIISEILKNPEFPLDQARDMLLADALRIIGDNKDVFQELENPSFQGWNDWQKDYLDLIDLVKNIQNYCDQPSELKRIVGN